MKEKIIKYFVKRWWGNDAFQKAIKEEIMDAPVAWCWNTLHKCLSRSGEYHIVHDANQMVPWTFTSEQQVRDQVAKWDAVVNMYKEAIKETATEEVVEENPVKPKRKYNRKKKDTKA